MTLQLQLSINVLIFQRLIHVDNADKATSFYLQLIISGPSQAVTSPQTAEFMSLVKACQTLSASCLWFQNSNQLTEIITGTETDADLGFPEVSQHFILCARATIRALCSGDSNVQGLDAIKAIFMTLRLFAPRVKTMINEVYNKI